MKKIKDILLIGVLIIGTLLFISCGASDSNLTPEEVSYKYLDNITKKDFNDENIKKETLDLIHSSVNNKEEAIKAATRLNSMFDSIKKEFELYGAGDKFDEFLKTTLDGIKIEKKNDSINGDKAELEYLVSVPTFDQSKVQKNVENLVKDKLKNVKLDNFDKDKLMKETMNEAVDLIISEIKKGEKVESENIKVELEKDNGNWKITSTY